MPNVRFWNAAAPELGTVDGIPNGGSRTPLRTSARYAVSAGKAATGLSLHDDGDLQEAISLPVSAKSLGHPVIVDVHAAENLVLALQHREPLPLEQAPG